MMTVLGPITLLTDFGLSDTYVGQMRGVIAGIAPTANVIDLTHAISPQDVLQGAIAWADAVAAFPPGTIHVGVVDPGVGTERRAIAAEIGAWRFVAPDNGLLTAIRRAWPTHAAVELCRSQWHRQPSSATFNGRDVFAPVAAHWANGAPLQELGTSLSAPLVEVPTRQPAHSDGEVRGCVLWSDRFGNLITNVTRADIPQEISPSDLQVKIAGQTIHGIDNCYGDRSPATLLALWNSSGRLEIAIRGASAAAELQTDRGAEVHVTMGKPMTGTTEHSH